MKIRQNRRPLLCWLPLIGVLAGCEATKSSNPLSPTIAGPIPGVSISPPRLLEPGSGSQINMNDQPIALVLENSSTTGVRPLFYLIEIAADSSFSTILVRLDNITPGQGRTTVRLPDRLASDRTYYWRALARDGANTGPYSGSLAFQVFTPLVIDSPVPIAPTSGIRIGTRAPSLTVKNATRSGPSGAIVYRFEVSLNDAFTANVEGATIPEQAGQTTFTMARNLDPDRLHFWRARAVDLPTLASSGWSKTEAFVTSSAPAPPPPPPPGPSPGGGGGHVPPGPLTEQRAETVIFGTGNEFPHLTAARGTESEGQAAAEELLRRMIWHLRLAGYDAGRQRNPSGVISGDKLTIFIGGVWRAYDVFGAVGTPGVPAQVQFHEVFPADPVPDAGIADGQ